MGYPRLQDRVIVVRVLEQHGFDAEAVCAATKTSRNVLALFCKNNGMADVYKSLASRSPKKTPRGGKTGQPKIFKRELWARERVKLIRQMHADGANLDEVCRELWITRQSVSRFCIKHGMQDELAEMRGTPAGTSRKPNRDPFESPEDISERRRVKRGAIWVWE